MPAIHANPRSMYTAPKTTPARLSLKVLAWSKGLESGQGLELPKGLEKAAHMQAPPAEGWPHRDSSARQSP